MADLLSNQLSQLAFAVVTGQLRLTPGQRAAIADLNAAAACAGGHGAYATLTLLPPPSKEPERA